VALMSIDDFGVIAFVTASTGVVVPAPDGLMLRETRAFNAVYKAPMVILADGMVTVVLELVAFATEDQTSCD
jgi:hypothetical protein